MLGRLSYGAFLLSMTALVMLSTGYNPFGLSYDVLFYFGVVVLGILGFLFSILSNFFDSPEKKVNAPQSFVFYLGMLFIFAGIVFKFMHYPFVIHLISIGIVVSFISLFIRVKGKQNNDDLLDS